MMLGVPDVHMNKWQSTNTKLAKERCTRCTFLNEIHETVPDIFTDI